MSASSQQYNAARQELTLVEDKLHEQRNQMKIIEDKNEQGTQKYANMKTSLKQSEGQVIKLVDKLSKLKDDQDNINQKMEKNVTHYNEVVKKAREEAILAIEQRNQAINANNLYKLILTTKNMKKLKKRFPTVNIPNNFGGTKDNSIINTVKNLMSDKNDNPGSRRFMINLVNSEDQNFKNHVKNYDTGLANLINNISVGTLHKLPLVTHMTAIETLQEYIDFEKVGLPKNMSLDEYIVDKYINDPDTAKFIQEWICVRCK